MIVLHHLQDSRSQRVLWLLEELGVDYEIHYYQRDPGTNLAPPELREVHPLGKSPVITDNGRTLAESGTIIDYLARSYGNDPWTRDPGDADYWDYDYWMHYAEGSLMPPLLVQLIFSKVRSSAPFFVRPIAAGIADQVDKAFTSGQIRTHCRFVEAHLADRKWFLGNAISAADIQMSFPLEAALGRAVPAEDYPHIADYVRRFQRRPAYRRALDAVEDHYAYGPDHLGGD
ncbi:MAG: glutathione S-transferase [Pseudomonadota bacterium]|nr:MAG: glutathione S-transferase [Pseudomonadota bacterium]